MTTLYITYDGAMDPLGQSQVIPYLTGLSSLGAEITLLSFEKKENLNNREYANELMRRLEKSNIKWVILKYHKSPKLPAALYDIMAGFLKAFRISSKGNIDFIHARSYIPGLIAYGIKRVRNIKYLLDIRGLWADERVDGDLWPKESFLYRITKRLEKTLLLNSASIVVLTNKAKTIVKNFDYMKDRNSRIDVIPTCADLNRFNIRQKDADIEMSLNIKDKFVFSYSGSIGTWYMLDEMIDFFKILKEKIKNSFFLFLANRDEDVIEAKMKKYGIPEEDYAVRSAAYSDVAKWLSAADASIFFIKPTFSKKTSCPTKFAESLGCGIPVITNSEVGDVDQIVRSNRIGVVIDRFDTASYKTAVNGLMALMNDRDALKTRCRNTAERLLSLRDGVKHFHEIYASLI